jgi:hypothetical protein
MVAVMNVELFTVYADDGSSVVPVGPVTATVASAAKLAPRMATLILPLPSCAAFGLMLVIAGTTWVAVIVSLPVAVPKLASPLYVAVIVDVPVTGNGRVALAVPETIGAVAECRVEAASVYENVTVPLGVRVVGATAATAAVNVTVEPATTVLAGTELTVTIADADVTVSVPASVAVCEA